MEIRLFDFYSWVKRKLRISLTCQRSHSSGTWQFQLISFALITANRIDAGAIHLHSVQIYFLFLIRIHISCWGKMI